MKWSLPVVLGIGALLLVALLIGNGFLSLPTFGGGEESMADATPRHDPAPRVDPQGIDVDYNGEEDPEKDKKKDRKKAGKKKGDRKKKSSTRAARKAGSKSATEPRKAPRTKDRAGGDKQGGVKPRPRKDGPAPRKDPEPQDPEVTVTDLRGDPQGEGQAPGYMDIEVVNLRASGDVFIAQLTFGAKIPAQMPDGRSNMLASLEVNRRGKKLSVYAEGSENGWRAHTNRSAEFPGGLEISGRTMRFTLARSFFGERFDWYAHSSWTKSTVTSTDYFFDFAPDDQNGRFPSGGTT